MELSCWKKLLEQAREALVLGFLGHAISDERTRLWVQKEGSVSSLLNHSFVLPKQPWGASGTCSGLFSLVCSSTGVHPSVQVTKRQFFRDSEWSLAFQSGESTLHAREAPHGYRAGLQQKEEGTGLQTGYWASSLQAASFQCEVPSSVAAAAAAAKSLQSCPTLCDPIDGSPPGSAVPGILQARTLEWVAISFSSAWEWKVKVKSFSPVWLFAAPGTAAYQDPSSMGFSRQEYWSGLPLPSPSK